MLVSFASYDPDGSWRKTCQGYSQVTLDGSLERFSETWPRAGMTLSGKAYRLPPLERCTDETESGSWPTPTGRDHKDGSAQACANVPANGLLGRVIHLWPTQTEDGNYNRKGASKTSGDGLATAAGGALNPAWVEILMGYPKGWTEL